MAWEVTPNWACLDHMPENYLQNPYELVNPMPKDMVHGYHGQVMPNRHAFRRPYPMNGGRLMKHGLLGILPCPETSIKSAEWHDTWKPSRMYYPDYSNSACHQGPYFPGRRWSPQPLHPQPNFAKSGYGLLPKPGCVPQMGGGYDYGPYGQRQMYGYGPYGQNFGENWSEPCGPPYGPPGGPRPMRMRRRRNHMQEMPYERADTQSPVPLSLSVQVRPLSDTLQSITVEWRDNSAGMSAVCLAVYDSEGLSSLLWLDGPGTHVCLKFGKKAVKMEGYGLGTVGSRKDAHFVVVSGRCNLSECDTEGVDEWDFLNMRKKTCDRNLMDALVKEVGSYNTTESLSSWLSKDSFAIDSAQTHQTMYKLFVTISEESLRRSSCADVMQAEGSGAAAKPVYEPGTIPKIEESASITNETSTAIPMPPSTESSSSMAIGNETSTAIPMPASTESSSSVAIGNGAVAVVSANPGTSVSTSNVLDSRLVIVDLTSPSVLEQDLSFQMSCNPADASQTSCSPADASRTSCSPADASQMSCNPADASQMSCNPADASWTSCNPADASWTSCNTADASRTSCNPADASCTSCNPADASQTSCNPADVSSFCHVELDDSVALHSSGNPSTESADIGNTTVNLAELSSFLVLDSTMDESVDWTTSSDYMTDGKYSSDCLEDSCTESEFENPTKKLKTSNTENTMFITINNNLECTSGKKRRRKGKSKGKHMGAAKLSTPMGKKARKKLKAKRQAVVPVQETILETPEQEEEALLREKLSEMLLQQLEGKKMLTVIQLGRSGKVYLVRGSMKSGSVEIPFSLMASENYEVRMFELETMPMSETLCVRRASKYHNISTLMTPRHLVSLQELAEKFVVNGIPKYHHLKYLYRNKPNAYFHDIFHNHGGIMKPYMKDYNGDRGSPINGKLKGLFFSAALNYKNGKIRQTSCFGDKRLFIPADLLFAQNTCLYFTDFYCVSKTSPHYVTLVLSVKDSDADTFCESRLLRLNPQNNPFLYKKKVGGCWQVFTCTCLSLLHVEVFYTEDIDIKTLLDLHKPEVSFRTVQTFGRGTSSLLGIPKNSRCSMCNLQNQFQIRQGVCL